MVPSRHLNFIANCDLKNVCCCHKLHDSFLSNSDPTLWIEHWLLFKKTVKFSVILSYEKVALGGMSLAASNRTNPAWISFNKRMCHHKWWESLGGGTPGAGPEGSCSASLRFSWCLLSLPSSLCWHHPLLGLRWPGNVPAFMPWYFSFLKKKRGSSLLCVFLLLKPKPPRSSSADLPSLETCSGQPASDYL